jgi:hypothetical protein
MKNIHLLPTSQPSRLGYISESKTYHLYNNDVFLDELANSINIYITSDEEIKEGDWFIHNGTIDGDLRTKFTVQKWYNNHSEKMYYLKDCKKIILTTDQDLINDGVQAIDDEFLEWFVKNQSCEKVDVDYRYDTNLQPILDSFGNKVLRVKIPTESEDLSQIIIPKEEPKPIHEQIIEHCGGEEKFMEICGLKPEQHVEVINDNIEQFDKAIKSFKQETLEEIFKNTYFGEKISFNSDIGKAFELGYNVAKEQDKNKYSEEDLEVAYFEGREGLYSFNDWFEQFKKK